MCGLCLISLGAGFFLGRCFQSGTICVLLGLILIGGGLWMLGKR